MKLNPKAQLLLALIATRAIVHAAPAPVDPTLTLLVHDYAGLPLTALEEVESETSALLSRAGLRLEWIVCHATWVGEIPEACRANATPTRFVVRIVDRHIGSAAKHGDPLGSAVIESHYATLYAGEIRRSAGYQEVAFSTLMAFAAAHEIGHLLLGPQHEQAGIMQAAWGKTAYRDMAQQWLTFGAADGVTMQDRVRGSLQASLAAK